MAWLLVAAFNQVFSKGSAQLVECKDMGNMHVGEKITSNMVQFAEKKKF